MIGNQCVYICDTVLMASVETSEEAADEPPSNKSSCIIFS